MKGINGILDYCKFSLFTRDYLQSLQLFHLKIIYYIHIKYFFSATLMFCCNFFILNALSASVLYKITQ